ncbi:MAG TPA: aspartyl/asparaginyl beta-hydroxylase domain-containing protein [Stenotrophobium sp.]|nr:aspartyl/asparaginyl beta-hydroxylase domain-containing protein [Stenotrophobium sp.]
MITAGLAIKIAVAMMFLLGGTYVHFRGKVRHRFQRQLLDHSTVMAPYNMFVYWRSAVPNTPMQDVSRFPQLALLRDNWQTIRDEAQALYGQGMIRPSDGTNDLGFNSFFRKGWTRFYLKWYGNYLPSALQQCPKTVELLKQTPSVKAAMFAVLNPGSELGPHRDPFAGSLRYHLGLVTPNSDACRIFVDGNMHSWRDGEDVVFDETYIHWAENKTDQYRIILFADVERPLKDRISRAINSAFARIAVASAASRNLPGEKLGVMNHLFAYIYSIRRLGKWMKQKNKFGYYTIKYILFGALLYWIFR